MQAVEKEQIPLSVAMTIAGSNDAAVQRALAEAYEKKELRGKALLKARRLIEERRSRGKELHRGVRSRANGEVSSEQLLKAYREETNRQKADRAEGKILRDQARVRRVGPEAALPGRQFHHAAAGRDARHLAAVPRGPDPWRSLLTMTNRIRLACDPRILVLPVSSILPTKKLTPGITKSREVPPHRSLDPGGRNHRTARRLTPRSTAARQYILLDGHIRLAILKEMGRGDGRVPGGDGQRGVSPTTTRSTRCRQSRNTL